MLAYTSYLDLKSREISFKVWFGFAIPIIVVSVIELLALDQSTNTIESIKRTLLGTIIVCVLTSLLFFAGILGGGDIVPLAIIGVSHPWNPLAGVLNHNQTILPPVLLVLAYASIAAASQSILILAYNLAFSRSEIRRLPNRRVKLVYALTAIPIRSAELIEKRFWFPLERPWDSRQRYRLYFSVEEDDSDLRARIKQMIVAKKVSEEQKIWATYGIPFVTFIFAGYIAMLLLGDSLILGIIRYFS